MILLAVPLAASTARIYVMNGAGDTVEVIDPATNKVVQVIEGIEAGHGVTFAPDGSRAYITDEAENALAVVDTKTAKSYQDGSPQRSTQSSRGHQRRKAGVGLHPGKAPLAGIEIVDTASLETIKKIPMKAGMHDIFMTPDGKYAGSPARPLENSSAFIDLQTGPTRLGGSVRHGSTHHVHRACPGGAARRIFVQLQGLSGSRWWISRSARR